MVVVRSAAIARSKNGRRFARPMARPEPCGPIRCRKTSFETAAPRPPQVAPFAFSLVDGLLSCLAAGFDDVPPDDAPDSVFLNVDLILSNSSILAPFFFMMMLCWITESRLFHAQ